MTFSSTQNYFEPMYKIIGITHWVNVHKTLRTSCFAECAPPMCKLLSLKLVSSNNYIWDDFLGHHPDGRGEINDVTLGTWTTEHESHRKKKKKKVQSPKGILGLFLNFVQDKPGSAEPWGGRHKRDWSQKPCNNMERLSSDIWPRRQPPRWSTMSS